MIVFFCIASLTLAMLAYWFRYSCLLLLDSRTSKDYSLHVAEASRLALPEICSRLEASADPRDLQVCRQALERDYRVVTRLIQRTSEHEAALTSQELFLLRADYAVLRLWDSLSSLCSGRPSRGALREIYLIVHFFANAAGSAGMLSLQDSSEEVAVSVAAR